MLEPLGVASIAAPAARIRRIGALTVVVPVAPPAARQAHRAPGARAQDRAAFDLLQTRAGCMRRRVRRGEYLFHAGAPCQALYGVCAGSFKTMLLTEDGREQVTGLHLTGEVLGLENIGLSACSGSAVALEDGDVVEIAFAELDALAGCDAALQRELFRSLASEIQRQRTLMLMLGSMRAEERLAAFLLDLSGRLAARGWSATHFILRMTREEIGSLLGLKLETVSRLLSRFQNEGLIHVRNREIGIRDMEALKAVIGRAETRRAAAA